MKFENLNGQSIPKIGYGTWKIGGRLSPEPDNDTLYLKALASALDLGYTHFDTAEVYAAGHSEELLGQAIRQSGKDRQGLFITSKVSPEHLAYGDVMQSCRESLQRLGLAYLDLYLIHWPMRGMHLPETFRALNQLVAEGRVRHLGVSNFNLKQMLESVSQCATPLFTNQVSYSLPDQKCVRNGVLGACREKGILLTAYSPVKRRGIRSKAFKALARELELTPQQLALAWLVNQPGVISIPASLDPQHQAENLAAGDITLGAWEMEALQGLKEKA